MHSSHLLAHAILFRDSSILPFHKFSDKLLIWVWVFVIGLSKLKNLNCHQQSCQLLHGKEFLIRSVVVFEVFFKGCSSFTRMNPINLRSVGGAIVVNGLYGILNERNFCCLCVLASIYYILCE